MGSQRSAGQIESRFEKGAKRCHHQTLCRSSWMLLGMRPCFGGRGARAKARRRAGGCAVWSNLNPSYLATPRCGYAGAVHLDRRYVVVVIWSRSAHTHTMPPLHCTITVPVCERCNYPRGDLPAMCGAPLRTIGSRSVCFPFAATDEMRPCSVPAGVRAAPHRPQAFAFATRLRLGGGTAVGVRHANSYASQPPRPPKWDSKAATCG